MGHLRLAIAAALVSCSAFAVSAPAEAGRIERACAASDRGARDTRLCACIQIVADQTLDRREQRLAASFFKDPHRAQEVRQSDRASHERFWLRYRAFGDAAERACR